MVPFCSSGAFCFTSKVAFNAAASASFHKLFAVVVVPFEPALALVTLPFLSTVIETTTIPVSLELYFGFGRLLDVLSLSE